MSLLIGLGASQAATLRVASAGDAGTLDPHTQNVLNTTQLIDQIYETLVGYGPDLNLVPGLAAGWQQVEPIRWRFELRRNVLFHDGAALTPADVAFSIRRAAAPGSNYSNFVDSVLRAEIVDDHTVDVVTKGPDPILPNKLAKVYVMREAWAEANGVVAPVIASQNAETYTSLHADGTGPFMLQERQPGVRTVLRRFDRWWGQPDGNVDEYVAVPIASDATRVAALLSGAVDLVLDPALQAVERLRGTPGMRIVEGKESRTLLLVVDQREPSPNTDVNGKNPLSDLRVRRALYQAIDIDSLTTRMMRGFAAPAGSLLAPSTHGFAPGDDERLPFDPAAAKRLLSEAGYPNGFRFILDCSNNRYPNDAAMCTALSSMWARVGVTAEVNAQPLQLFFPKAQRRDSSMYLIAIGSPMLDAFYSFQVTMLPPSAATVGDGTWNNGYSNPVLTPLIERIRTEMDPAQRDALIAQVMRGYREDLPSLPLYRQVIAWAMRDTIQPRFRPDAILVAKWVTVQQAQTR